MKSLRHYLKYFMSQSGPNDCGPACIAMILNFCGRQEDAVRLINNYSAGQAGLSLLQMKSLAGEFGLQSRCVEMESDFLRSNKTACILHLQTASGNHFAVCFGARKTKAGYKYIIADPATGVRSINGQELSDCWIENAALYFDDLKESASGILSFHWFELMGIPAFRKTLLITVPFLNISSALLGIGITWMLQKGLNDSFLDERTTIVIALMVLLFILTTFKSVVAYIRQTVLIVLNSEISQHLYTSLIGRVIYSSDHVFGSDRVKKALGDLQKIQSAVNLFISVIMADGSIVLLVTAGLWFYEPVTGAFNSAYLMIMFYIAANRIPEETSNNLRMQELSGICEKGLAGDGLLSGPIITSEKRLALHIDNYNRFHRFTKSSAKKIGHKILWFEFAGTLNVILIFIFCLYRNRSLKLSYPALMTEVLLSYLITILVPKICSAFPVISEGALLVRRYRQR